MKKGWLLFLILMMSILYPAITSKAEMNKIAYLTFDDGPSHNTEAILEILKQNEIKATFFVLGNNVKRLPDLVQKIKEEGNALGLHSMTHSYDRLYGSKNDPTQFINEYLEEQQLIFDITGDWITLIRPPYSSKYILSEAHVQAIKDTHFKVWDWHIDSKDWCANSIYEIEMNIHGDLELAHYPNKVVILMHEKNITVRALPSVINKLKEEGYSVFLPYDEKNHFPINFHNDPSL